VPDVQRGDAAGHEWAVACELHPGEDSLGDAFVVHEDGDRLLVAVIDGLGHGRDANHASRAVAAAVRQVADRELVEIVAHCHDKAQRTRGAVMSLVAVTASSVEWVGVGNVETALIRADRDAARPVESMMLTGGVVGYQLPPLRPRTIPVATGDLLVLATDGIRADFADSVIRHDAPHLIVARLMRTLNTGDDDSLVLTLRVGGEGGGGSTT
jgi:phosphoserine phosphatase RsbX